MSVRHNLAEYPEHLNPFHARKNSFKESFRGLKNTLYKSFTGKDKKRPEIRKRENNTDIVPQSRHTLAVISRVPVQETPLLPRSRFSERVATKPNTSEQINPCLTSEQARKNPFDEETCEVKNKQRNQADSSDTPPRPAERKKIKKKKKAPIPPNVGGDSHLTVPSDVNNSKWSLVSTDTDVSSACYSDYETDLDASTLVRNEQILQITEEIKEFVHTKSNISGSRSEIDVNEKIVDITEEIENSANTDNTIKDIHNERTEDQNSQTTVINIEKQENKDNSSPQISELNLKHEVEPDSKSYNGMDTANDDHSLTESPVDFDNQPSIITNSETTQDKMKEKVLDDHNNNVQTEDPSVNNIDLEINNGELRSADLIVSECRTVVIAESHDGLEREEIYEENESLYISGPSSLYNTQEKSITKDRIEFFENTSPQAKECTSVLKVRKNILSKENMLG